MYIPALATPKEMCRFHSQDYIEFLERVTPKNVDEVCLLPCFLLLSFHNLIIFFFFSFQNIFNNIT
jgi:acetoin utilization deacetylase AcuC-like enzyme